MGLYCTELPENEAFDRDAAAIYCSKRLKASSANGREFHFPPGTPKPSARLAIKLTCESDLAGHNSIRNKVLPATSVAQPGCSSDASAAHVRIGCELRL